MARAIASIPEDAWTPVKYPGAVRDPDSGEWISDAEVAEIPYTAFTPRLDRVTARLIVRRVKDAARQDELFPVWRYHPFFTDSTEPTVDADLTHRRHAVIETVFADLIDGPLAQPPHSRPPEHPPNRPYDQEQQWKAGQTSSYRPPKPRCPSATGAPTAQKPRRWIKA